MPEDTRQPFDVVVLGGGITGLVSAWKLAVAGQKVALLEKGPLAGGMIQTVRDGDWLLETGPNSISFRENDDVHGLINALGLGDELLMRPIRESDRYIWRRGMLRRVPVSPLQMLQKNALSRHMITRAAGKIWRKQTLADRDVSVGAYFSACLGRKLVNDILAPAMVGIYAADPFCLSMQSVMPRLYQAAGGNVSFAGALRKMKKDNKAATGGEGGRRMLASFRNGMSTLTGALVRQAEDAGVDLCLRYEIAEIKKLPGELWQVTGTDGREVTAKRLLCTLPAGAASSLLQITASKTATELGHIQYAPMIMAHIGVKENDVDVCEQGFGYLAVRESGVRSLGMIWNDRMFAGRAPSGHRLFTVFLGGDIDRAICDLTDTEIFDAVKADLRLAMKWRGNELALARITRLDSAIPLMEVGHAVRLQSAQSMLPRGMHITGNYVAGVSVPSCMRAGMAIAEKLGAEK